MVCRETQETHAWVWLVVSNDALALALITLCSLIIHFLLRNYLAVKDM